MPVEKQGKVVGKEKPQGSHILEVYFAKLGVVIL